MARGTPGGVEPTKAVGRAAGAAARWAVRKGVKRGIRAIATKAAAATTTQPHVAAVVVGVVAAVVVILVLLLVIVAAIFGITGAASASCKDPGAPATGTIKAGKGEPPANLIPWLVRAANQPGHELGARGPAVLAGIAKVESDFGRSRLEGIRSGVNFLGCCAGPFQFNLLDTWDGYSDDPGADADGSGDVDVYNFADASFAAARKLASQGAPEDWNSALLAYNRSTAYVEKVLDYADQYQGPIAEEAGGELPADPVRSRACTKDAGESGGGGGGAGEPLGPLPEEALPRVKQIAEWIDEQQYPYCWGGGHDSKPGPDSSNTYCWNAKRQKIYNSKASGLDCSGAVRWLLVMAGFPDPGGIVAASFAGVYPSGPGKHVTIWSNSAHVFITIDGRGWGTSRSNYAHGPGWTGYSTSGFTASHPPGL